MPDNSVREMNALERKHYSLAARTFHATVMGAAILGLVALLIGLGLGIHLKQSRACAVAPCVIGVINVIVGIATSGTPSGYLVLIAGILAIVYTFKLEKAWQQYQAQ